MSKEKAIELKKLAEDLYNQGYHCAINDDKWFEVYATAMFIISNNDNVKFNDELIDSIIKELKV